MATDRNPTPEPLERLLTLDDCAEVTQLCTETIRLATKEPDGLRSVRFGRALRVPESALRAWIQERTQKSGRAA